MGPTKESPKREAATLRAAIWISSAWIGPGTASKARIRVSIAPMTAERKPLPPKDWFSSKRALTRSTIVLPKASAAGIASSKNLRRSF
jgi:hypothetical protein